MPPCHLLALHLYSYFTKPKEADWDKGNQCLVGVEAGVGVRSQRRVAHVLIIPSDNCGLKKKKDTKTQQVVYFFKVSYNVDLESLSVKFMHSLP